METENKAVLISIQPKWCELIASGQKTLEVRKTKPKLKPPFKCYIYCTLKGSNEFFKENLNGDVAKWNRGKWDLRKGKVIGEFTCDTFVLDRTYGHDPLFYGAACMNAIEVAAYALNNPMYGWHISDFKIYDKPRELSEFANSSSRLRFSDTKDGFPLQWSGLQKPPQSWCYVKEVQNNVKP